MIDNRGTETEIRERITDILSRPEFRPRTRGLFDWLGERLREFLEWLGDLFHLGGNGSVKIPLPVVYALAIALLVACAILVARRLLPGERRAQDGATSDAARRAARAAELLQAAREAAQRGDLTSAARRYFWALVVGLSERGAIEYRDSWTCREALDRGEPKDEIRALLAPLVPRLDAMSFGHAPVHDYDVDELATLCERWLAEPAR